MNKIISSENIAGINFLSFDNLLKNVYYSITLFS